LWDDDANDPVTDHAFTSGVVATPLSPEGRLSAFRGENPNGVWTLSIADDLAPIAGTLNAWSLDLTSMNFTPNTSSSVWTSSPNIAIPDNSTVTDSINVSGMGTALSKVVLYTELMHTWSSDLDVTLTSPAGTVVTVTTDNANDLDDVYNGTVWDPSATDTVTDHVYTNLVVATPLSPEGSFDNFLGQDPNGLWTLTVTDDFIPDTGTFVRWDLTLSTCSQSVPVAYCAPSAPGSSHGCLPTISAPANPNVAHTNSCVITVSGVEGQKSGIVFYGVHGPINQPWCTGGHSFLCIKAPTQRTMSQNSGGTPGQCNGTLVLDWNAYQLAHPLALGNPWLVGQKANVQGWFRDPASCKTTFLSQAIELTYQP
jgi:subtilisin-like proprotein convertase family protein